jgi:hypothetical protein
MLWTWQEALTAYQAIFNEGCRGTKRAGTPYESPRLSTAEALDRAAAMVERMHRLYLKTLKALQDQRRLSAPVIVRRAGQVNIGAQQINLSGRP